MKTYDFTLRYRLPKTDSSPESHVDRLARAGCEDALIGIGQNGRIALNFTSEAESALEAVASAMEDVQRAIPEARLIEAEPDLIGISDMAEILDVSRQYVRKLVQTREDTFPEPVHEGRPSLWHLAEIMSWFRLNVRKDVPRELEETAGLIMQLNVFRDCRKSAAMYERGFQFSANAPTEEFRRTLESAIRPTGS